MRAPDNGWFIMENPGHKWMIWGYLHLWWVSTFSTNSTMQHSMDADAYPCISARSLHGFAAFKASSIWLNATNRTGNTMELIVKPCEHTDVSCSFRRFTMTGLSDPSIGFSAAPWL